MNTVDIFFLWGSCGVGCFMGYRVLVNPNIQYHLFASVLFTLSAFNLLKGFQRIAHDYPNIIDLAQDGAYFLAFVMGILFYNKGVKEHGRV